MTYKSSYTCIYTLHIVSLILLDCTNLVLHAKHVLKAHTRLIYMNYKNEQESNVFALSSKNNLGSSVIANPQLQTPQVPEIKVVCLLKHNLPELNK